MGRPPLDHSFDRADDSADGTHLTSPLIFDCRYSKVVTKEFVCAVDEIYFHAMILVESSIPFCFPCGGLPVVFARAGWDPRRKFDSHIVGQRFDIWFVH